MCIISGLSGTYPCVRTQVVTPALPFLFAGAIGAATTARISAKGTAVVGTGAPDGGILIPWLLLDCPQPSIYPDEAGVTGNPNCPYTFSANFSTGPFVNLKMAAGSATNGNFKAAALDPVPDCPQTADGLFGHSGGNDYFNFLLGTTASPPACPVAKGARIRTKTGNMATPTDNAMDSRDGTGLSGCMNATAFDDAVEVVDASQGLVNVKHFNACLVAVALVVHADPSYPGIDTDTPGGDAVAQMQNPDPVTRLSPLSNGSSELMLVRRFALFYITQRNPANNADWQYRGLFLKTVTSLDVGPGTGACTAADGVCTVKQVYEP